MVFQLERIDYGVVFLVVGLRVIVLEVGLFIGQIGVKVILLRISFGGSNFII